MILKNSTNLFFVFLLLLLTLTNANAARKRGEYATKNLAGQDLYLEKCSSCHGEGSRGGNMASIREWKVIFSENALELKDLHLDDEESKNVVTYLNSNEFKNSSEQMLKFLQEFAYDSEHIPTCN